MISRYEAYMDGQALSHVHPGIQIMDIAHSVSSVRRQMQSIANRNGMVILSKAQDSTSVEILFALRLYSIQERQAALQKIQQWAQGSILETNDREGQRLHVVCDAFPTIQSALGWTDVLSIQLTAYEKPFWENKTPSVLVLNGSDTQGRLFVPGNAGDAFAEVTVTPQQTIHELTVIVADTMIRLEQLSTDQVITIGYDEHGYQYIKAGNDSILSKRTAASSDDLIAICGKKNTVSVQADNPVMAKIQVRGLWL